MINKNTTTLYYLKYPTAPIFDYYIDVNGNYVYLAAGATHTWVTGEKDSTGATHTTGDADWNSLTVELEWKDQDKLKIVTKILRNLGIRLSDAEVFQYSQQQKSEV